jgi:hypothetical protein
MRWELVLVVVGRVVAWELTLLHVNDIHVRMEETNKYSAACRYTTAGTALPAGTQQQVQRCLQVHNKKYSVTCTVGTHPQVQRCLYCRYTLTKTALPIP